MLEAQARHRIWCPGDFYIPHSVTQRSPQLPENRLYDRKGRPSGQLQFHQSTHRIRIMAPGNGWGGTTCMAAEIDAWMRGTNRWQVTPPAPVWGVWFAPEFRQLDGVMVNLKKIAFGSVPRLLQSGFGGPRLIWPNGSFLQLASYDRSWAHHQGTEPFFVAFDEQPPAPLWREMLMRSRGRYPTRFMCKATQTKGWGWMAEDIYMEWRDYHIREGITDEEAMMEAQLHPDIWCWPRGGIHDNSSEFIGEKDDLWYERRKFPSTKEYKVRTFGGFEQWSGDCIFEEATLDWLRLQVKELDEEYGIGEDGSLVPVYIDAQREPEVGEEEPGWWNNQRPAPSMAPPPDWLEMR